MQCKMCGGAGVIQGQSPGLVSCCPACEGKGFIELTNEEWRKTCSVEEFAEWIATQCGNAVMENTYDVSKLRKKRYWEEWLKEKHDEM